MKENPQDILTVEVFNKLLAKSLEEKLSLAFEQFRIDFGAEIRKEINALDQKMMSGFEAVFRRFDEIDNKFDSVEITKADVKDVLLLEKRVTKLEEKLV